MSFDLDELTHRYVTRSELDGLRKDVRADFNRLNDSITRLVDQLSKTSLQQEKMVATLELAHQRSGALENQLSILCKTVQSLENERIAYQAKWRFLFDFKPILGKFFQFFLLISAFSMVSLTSSDFLYWLKSWIKNF